MPSTTVPPLPPGKDTSEFSLAKLFTLIGGLVAVLIPLLTALTGALDGLQTIFPGAKWIAAIAGVLGVLMTIATTINKYITGRADVKVAHLEAASRAGQAAAYAVKTDADADKVLNQ